MPALPDYRESTERSIYVSGEINAEMVYRLTPQIDHLRTDAGDPPRSVTVFIDSPGGEIGSAAAISQLLRQDRLDLLTPRIITVVRNYAASAAADLLARGDYAIAYTGAKIHYHGSRLFSAEVTRERAELILESLNRQNDRFALRLARRVFDRFVFHYGTLRAEFDDTRGQLPQQKKKGSATDLECFAALLFGKLALQPAKAIKAAFGRRKRVRQLFEHVVKSVPKSETLSPREREVRVFRAILAFELRRNRQAEWRLSKGGLEDLVSDFLSLIDYLSGAHRNFRGGLVERLGPMLLPDAKLAEFERLQDAKDLAPKTGFLEQEVGRTVDDLWYFTLSLCRILQQDEYPLSAVDAYWLGIVDEVAGEDLPNLRLLMENLPPVEPLPPLSST